MSKEFYFKVIDKQGHYHEGNIQSNNIKDAAYKLKEQGYYIVKLSEKTGFNFKFPLVLKKVKAIDLAIMNRQLSVMLNAGITLLDALTIMEKQNINPYLEQILVRVRKRVQEGISFSNCLKEHPKVFNKMMVKIVEAGELGGVLDKLTLELAEHFEREHEIIEKIKGAMLYPVIVFTISLAAVIFLTLFVLPTFAVLLGEMASQLPLSTQLLLFISSVLKDYWLLITLILLILFIATYSYCMTQKGKKILDLILLKLPVYGRIYNQILVARFGRTLGTLLGAGVPIIQALEVSAETTDNYIFTEHIEQCSINVQAGESMVKSLYASWLFPNMIVQIVKIGEETGNLDKLLLQIGNHFQKEVDKKLDKLSTLIEPVMIIMVGIIVGFIVISMVLPIFNIISSF